MKGNNKIKGVINEKISDKKTFTYIDDIWTLLDGKVLFINNGNKYILEPVENGAIQIKFYKGFVTEIESREFWTNTMEKIVRPWCQVDPIHSVSLTLPIPKNTNILYIMSSYKICYRVKSGNECIN